MGRLASKDVITKDSSERRNNSDIYEYVALSHRSGNLANKMMLSGGTNKARVDSEDAYAATTSLMSPGRTERALTTSSINDDFQH